MMVQLGSVFFVIQSVIHAQQLRLLVIIVQTVVHTNRSCLEQLVYKIAQPHT